MNHNNWRPERRYHITNKNHIFHIYHRFFSVCSVYLSSTWNPKIGKVLLKSTNHLCIYMSPLLLPQMHLPQSISLWVTPLHMPVLWRGRLGKSFEKTLPARLPGLEPPHSVAMGASLPFLSSSVKWAWWQSLLSQRAGVRIKCAPFMERT